MFITFFGKKQTIEKYGHIKIIKANANFTSNKKLLLLENKNK